MILNDLKYLVRYIETALQTRLYLKFVQYLIFQKKNIDDNSGKELQVGIAKGAGVDRKQI